MRRAHGCLLLLLAGAVLAPACAPRAAARSTVSPQPVLPADLPMMAEPESDFAHNPPRPSPVQLFAERGRDPVGR